MPLPDISRLEATDRGRWRALGLRLAAIGLTAEAIDPVADIGEGLPPQLRAPLRRWRLDRGAGPVNSAMRLLVFGDSVSRVEVAEALGDSLLDPLLDAGLVSVREDGRIACRIVLGVAHGLYVFADDLAHGGDAVMGVSETTANLCRAAWTGRTANRVLDLGCGAATAGLVLSRAAEHVVATDINPRALALARLNAAVNGVENIEFRLGDCFEAVRGETFDLIVSQPPFVPRPPDARDAAYLYGGTRGDELPLRMLGEMAPHMAPQSRAVVLVEWAEPAEEKLAAAIGAGDARCLHLCLRPTEPDLHCGMYAAAEAAELGEAFERRVRVWRDHFEALGIQTLRTVCTVMQRDPGIPPWSEAIELPGDTASLLQGPLIDRWIANRDLARLSPETLLTATLRVHDAAVFAKEYTLEGAKPRYTVRVEDDPLAQAVELGEDIVLLLSLLHQEPSVASAVEHFAVRRGMDPGEAVRQLMSAVQQAAAAGIIRTSRPETPYRR